MMLTPVLVLQMILVVAGLSFIAIFSRAVYRQHKANTLDLRQSWKAAIVGLVANFVDTLGVSSFAVMTACFKNFKMMEDSKIPGTLNVAATMATYTQAFLFLGAVEVEPITLISMILSSVIGALVGAKVVSGLNVQKVRIGMGTALLVMAVLIIAGQLKLFPAGGEAMGLEGNKLLIGVIGNFLIGMLLPIGIGNFAPCMTLVYMLGMHPLAAFPIMMGAAALMMAFSSYKFVKSGAYAIDAALMVNIFGVVGVLLAVGLVKSLNVSWINWLLIAVVVYTAISMFSSYYKALKQVQTNESSLKQAA
ncbi:sulfite exporter TauE/SafE family protein [Limibacter armeniacum]|uniref:sulfite exporter TauE/SafE family protein n=1 Tax=Limibacter armeniacum TaxID=466084 RepID=UPI002FE59365